MTKPRGEDGASRARAARALRVCCVGDGKETQRDGEQGEAAAIPAGLIFRQSLRCVPRALMHRGATVLP